MSSSAWSACSSARFASPVRRWTWASELTARGGVLVATDLERDGERMLEVLDRLVRLAEQELDPSEVVQKPADVGAVGELLVLHLRLLGIGAGEDPVTRALGQHRGLEVSLAEGPCVVHRLGELERTLDVLPRCLVVALPPVAPRAPGEDAEPELVGGKA